MSRQDDRIARQRAGAAEADRIITDAINAAWNRIEARESARCYVVGCAEPPVDGMVPLNPNMVPPPPAPPVNPACRQHALDLADPIREDRP